MATSTSSETPPSGRTDIVFEIAKDRQPNQKSSAENAELASRRDRAEETHGALFKEGRELVRADPVGLVSAW